MQNRTAGLRGYVQFAGLKVCSGWDSPRRWDSNEDLEEMREQGAEIWEDRPPRGGTNQCKSPGAGARLLHPRKSWESSVAVGRVGGIEEVWESRSGR